MIQFPPLPIFDDGQLDDGKKLVKKIFQEAASLFMASQYDNREHILDEFADVLQALANFSAYSGITSDELSRALERRLKKNAELGYITDAEPFID